MSPETKIALFFLLFLFVGRLILVGMSNINAPAGEVTVTSSDLIGVGPDDVPQGVLDIDGIFQFMVKLGRGILAAITAPILGYDFLGNPLQPSGGSFIRVLLTIISLIGVWVILDYIRRFIRG